MAVIILDCHICLSECMDYHSGKQLLWNIVEFCSAPHTYQCLHDVAIHYFYSYSYEMPYIKCTAVVFLCASCMSGPRLARNRVLLVGLGMAGAESEEWQRKVSDMSAASLFTHIKLYTVDS